MIVNRRHLRLPRGSPSRTYGLHGEDFFQLSGRRRRSGFSHHVIDANRFMA